MMSGTRVLAALAAAVVSVLVCGSAALGQEFGGFGAATSYPVGTNPQSAVLVDVDLDGDVDVVVANTGSTSVGVLLNDGSGALGLQQVNSLTGLGVVPNRIVSGDFNEDGIPDFAVTTPANDRVSILIGTGSAMLAAPTDYPVGDNPQSLVTGDFNGDGHVDIATANLTSNDVSLLLGDGAGAFAPHVVFAAGTAPRFIAAGDLDDDGNLDVVVTQAGGNGIAVLFGNGDGTVSAPLSVPSIAATTAAISIGDLDGDNALDIVYVNTNSTAATVFLGHGDGTFSSASTYTLGATAVFAVLHDFDGDTDLDLIAASQSPHSLRLILGNGDGTFAAPQTFTAGLGPSVIAVSDMDGNSTPDLAVANASSNSVSVLLNLTDILPPGDFDLLSPADNAVGLPLPETLAQWPGGKAGTAPLKWSTATGFQNEYTVRISLDPAFTMIVLEDTVAASPFNIPDGVLEIGKRYYWTVDVENPIGLVSAASGSFTFAMRALADLNADGIVSGADLAILLSSWGSAP